MKIRHFVFVSLILTAASITALLICLPQNKDLPPLIMLNFFLMMQAAGSWILTLIAAMIRLIKKKNLAGLKSYRICILIQIIISGILGIIFLITEKAFAGSSAQWIVTYLFPLQIITYLILRGIGNKKNNQDG